jgi:thymidylate synthase (FAD)
MEEVNCMEGKNLVKDGLLDGRGFVRVIKVSPETHPQGYTPEYLIAKAARLSYGSDNKSAKADKSLIEYLVRHKHTSPLEMCSITFCIKLPIAMCRQLLRHRTGKFNEFSQRYTEVPEEDNRFKPDETIFSFRGPCKLSKQASEMNLEPDQIETIRQKMRKIEEKHDEIFTLYKELLDDGLAKEIARFYLPVSTYTEIYVQFDLNNLLKFFQLRCAEDAQYEIRAYAYAMKDLASQFFPICLGMYEQYKDGHWIGELEKQMIRDWKIPDEVTSRTMRDSLTKLANELGIHLKEEE